jgi:hypothetical protein
MTGPKFANDGYSRLLTEGSLRKGGNNTSSQIQTRPPAPAPMRPAANNGSSGGGASIPPAPSPKR